MPFMKLSRNYHDSQVANCRIGPQREVILEIRLDPVWNPTTPSSVELRFRAIQNFEEVRAFFQRIQNAADREFLDEVVGIVCKRKGEWTVDLDRGGAVTIATPKLPQEY
jgi:hypothetical protein